MNARLTTAETAAALIKGCAHHGLTWGEEAAIHLLITQGTWLRSDEFRAHITAHPIGGGSLAAWVDWTNLADQPDASPRVQRRTRDPAPGLPPRRAAPRQRRQPLVPRRNLAIPGRHQRPARQPGGGDGGPRTASRRTPALMNALSFRLGWPLYAGMLVAGAAAVVASASTLATLAHTAGWSSWTPWLLPAALDIGGCAGGWCWLRPGVPESARRFGRIVALAGAAGSLIGNAAGHLLSTGYLSAGPVLVVIVGAVPAAVLVALAHLAALLAAPPAPMSDAEPGHPGHVRTEQMDDEQTDEIPGQRSDKQADQDELHVTDEQTDPDQQRATDETGRAREDEDADERDEIGEQDDAGDRDETDEQPDGPDTRDAVLQLLHQDPLTIAELAKATGRSRTTVIGHLTALTRAGAVQRDDSKRYRATTRPHLITQRNETGPEEAAR